MFFIWGGVTGAWLWSRLDARFERKVTKVDDARVILNDAYRRCKTGMTFAPECDVYASKPIVINGAPFLLTLRPDREDQSHD